MKPESFPSWIYHATEPAYVCMTEAEFDALPAEWADHPDLVVKPSGPVITGSEYVEMMREELGIPFGSAGTASGSAVEAPKRRGRPPKAE